MTAGSFQLYCAITVDDVSDVRRIVEKLHSRIMNNTEDMSRVAMATHELLENAVKFSADGNASIKIEVIEGRQVRITTRNIARSADVEGLKTITKELEAALDPMVYYLKRMQQAPAARGGLGLGLGRVAAEGEMRIGIALDGDVVEVRASSSLSPPSA